MVSSSILRNKEELGRAFNQTPWLKQPEAGDGLDHVGPSAGVGPWKSSGHKLQYWKVADCHDHSTTMREHQPCYGWEGTGGAKGISLATGRVWQQLKTGKRR